MSDNFLSEEDKHLFRKAIDSIKTLKKDKRVNFFLEKTQSLSTENKAKALLSNQNKEIFYLSDAYSEEVHAESLLSYCIPSFPRKRFYELKNGRIPWQSSIDLHGLRPDTAKEELTQFIVSQRAQAHRCLLIIHGKGSHRGEAPILKNLVNHWLRQFPDVLAFHSALGHEGGKGAVYVLLKRKTEAS